MTGREKSQAWLPRAAAGAADRHAVEHATDGSPPEGDRTAALADRLFLDAVGALELYTVYLGERLGLYRALADDGPATSSELAGPTGTAERYVREWLEHHAASGLLEVDDPRAEPLARRYRLPPEHVPVLVDTDDLRYQAYMGVDVVRINLSHGHLDGHLARLHAVRQAAERTGCVVAVLADLPGPKVRAAQFPDGGVELAAGSTITLRTSVDASSRPR